MKGRKDTKIFCDTVACIGMVLLLISCVGCGSSKPIQQTQVQAWNSATASRELFARANDARASKDLHGLNWNENLAALAQDHARKMAAKEHLSHDGFQRRFDALRQSVPVSRLTENVAMGQGHANPAATTVQMWIESAGHRRNLYDRNVTITGVGFAISDRGRFYYAQLYGR